MQHPVQALITTDSLLITASNATLASFDLATSALHATATPHKSFVRLLATYFDPASEKSYLISTGEDKHLVVSLLPSLELQSSRELPKRANALDVTEDGEIVVGDKFGDVYIFPLIAPVEPAPTSTPAPASKDDTPKYAPVLGHVSMLNTLALIPAREKGGKSYIATGDRDEHVRVSRFPEGWVVEGFLWGSKHFVSSLLYLPPATSSPEAPSYLLSAGGDPTLQLFSLSLPPSSAGNVGSLISQFNVEDLLTPYLAVGPETPQPVGPGRRKRGGKGKGKKEEGAEDEEGEGEKEEEAEAYKGGEEMKKGLAVIKMVEVGTTREQGGVVVLASGSTALLYIPFSALLPPSSSTSTPSTTVPSLLPFAYPILDFTPLPVPSSSGSACEFLLSFDTTRGPFPLPSPASSAPASSSEETPPPVARVALTQAGQLEALPTLTTDAILLSSATTPVAQQPGVQSLYPVLMLLHHPGDESEFAFGGGEADLVGDGKPKGGKVPPRRGTKRASTDRGERDDELGLVGERRAGKRAIGRAETLRRWEEAKRKMESGAGEEGLTQGEKEAVAEMEKEAEGEKVAQAEASAVA
ncbi:hypothetical protein JCM1841_006444 [Sporobolomyces salmonicolor]